MSTAHLTSEELDLVMLGEGLPAARAMHLGGCLVCRRRRDELVAVIAGARAADPPEEVRARIRNAALAASGHRDARPRWWLAAAAALLLAAFAAVFVATRPQPVTVDTEAILLEVDEVLARDPLTAFADESVVEVLVAESAAAPETPPSS